MRRRSNIERPVALKMRKYSNQTLRFTIFGIAFGLCFPVTVTCLDVFVNGLDFNLESLIEVQSGDYHHWIINTAPLFLGLLANRAGVFLDRSNRLNKVLNESEEKYRHFFKALPQAVVITDKRGDIIDHNPAARDMFSLPAEISKENPVSSLQLKLFQEDGRPLSQRNFPSLIAFQSGHAVHKIYCVESPREKTHRTVVIDSIPRFFDDDSEPGYVVNISKDITAIKKSERELIESESKYRRIAESIPGNVMVYQRNLTGSEEIIYVSGGVTKLYGITQQEALSGASWFWNRMHHNDIAVVKASLRESERSMKVWQGEHRLVMLDKSIKWIYYQGIPNRDSKGVITWDIVQLDITEKKLLADQLQQTQKMESVGRLAGSVAHDFNNMLSVILGNLELVMSGIDTDHEDYPILEEIKTAADRSASLTKQLLAFSRKDSNSPQTVQINNVFNSMSNVLRRLIGESVRLTWIPGESLNNILIDPNHVDQILANLCVNARDAVIGDGEIKVETSNCSFDADHLPNCPGMIAGSYVMLSVSDNGCGMSPEVVSQVFEPFFTTKKENEGTGLGLATVYGLVSQSDGYISIESQPGEGTSVKIYFPRYQGEETQEATRDQEQEKPEEGRGTILLVEDEPAILRVAEKILSINGYRVLATHSPMKAMSWAEEHRNEIDLILTDVIMPEMNGRELVESIVPLCSKAKVLFMSGHTGEIINIEEIKSGKFLFLPKPFTASDLRAKVKEVMEEEV